MKKAVNRAEMRSTAEISDCQLFSCKGSNTFSAAAVISKPSRELSEVVMEYIRPGTTSYHRQTSMSPSSPQ